MNDISHFAKELIRLGTRCVFGIPGEGATLSLIDELEKAGAVFYAAPHEAAGALLAGGFGRAAGIPGVSLSIKGPGFSNMLAGIASNWLDRNPALSLAESYGPGSSSFRMHKRMDHAAMVRPVSKAYADNVSPVLLESLWDLCIGEEPGPVHFDISQRMDQTTIAGESARTTDSMPLTTELRQRLRDSSRPVIIAGSLAARNAWGKKLRALQIPVFTTFAGKGAMDETLPHAGGVFTNSGGVYAPESSILPRTDLVVGLGLRTTEILDVKPLPAPLVLADVLSGRGEGLDPLISVEAETETFVEILEILGDKEWGGSELAKAKAVLEDKLALDRWLPAAAFRMSQETLADTAVFFLDTGSFCTMGEHTLAARRPLHVLGSALGRSMGVGIPSAVGAAMALRGTPVVAATGDGGMRLYPECLALAVHEKLPLLVLFMADGYFSSIRQVAVEKGLSQDHLRLPSSGWTGAVKAWGCPSERIESLPALHRALTDWKATGPLFLELVFDADDYMAMTRGIR